jgi:sigma-E factor negative regulatory protein RseA
MNNPTDQVCASELLSALADGELDALQATTLVQASRLDASVMQTWASYHAIGQAMRAHASDAARAPVQLAAQFSFPPTAANDSVFRWKLVAGVAALAAMGSMVWALVGTPGQAGVQLAQRSAPGAAVVAAAQAPAPAAASALSQTAAVEAPQIMIRDPYLDELLAAHKQFGGASALQQPAGFLRNATFQTAGR